MKESRNEDLLRQQDLDLGMTENPAFVHNLLVASHSMRSMNGIHGLLTYPQQPLPIAAAAPAGSFRLLQQHTPLDIHAVNLAAISEGTAEGAGTPVGAVVDDGEKGPGQSDQIEI